MTIPQQECKEKPGQSCEDVPRRECKKVFLKKQLTIWHIKNNQYFFQVPREKCTTFERDAKKGSCRVETRMDCRTEPRQQCQVRKKLNSNLNI